MPVLQTPTTARCLRACGRDRVPLLRAGIRTSNDCAHSPEWSRDPSVDQNSGALDLVILDDRATPVGGVAHACAQLNASGMEHLRCGYSEARSTTSIGWSLSSRCSIRARYFYARSAPRRCMILKVGVT